MPDINISTERWEIEGEFIRAPIDLLMGIGEKAHEELMAQRPYADLEILSTKLKILKPRIRLTEDASTLLRLKVL